MARHMKTSKKDVKIPGTPQQTMFAPTTNQGNGFLGPSTVMNR